MSTQGVGRINQSTGNTGNQAKRPVQITIKSGDTLTKIAKKFGMNTDEFKQWVGLKSNNLKAGDVINLPNAEIPQGKGIMALARQYNMTLEEFGKLNNLPKPYKEYNASKGEKFYVRTKPQAQETPETKPATKPVAKPTTTPATKTEKPVEKPATQPAETATASKNKATWGSSYTPAELGKMIYSKAGEYYGAVGKPDFDALINEINFKNVTEVLQNYNKNPKNKDESLLTTITHEVKSDPEKRKEAVMHIFDALAKRIGTAPEIRENFKKELDKQFDSWGMVNTEKLDETLNRMMATPKELATKMKNEIHGKWGAIGKESFNELVSLVTHQNVAQVITEYDNLKTGESLIEGITSEVNSSKDSRKEAVMHIYDALAKAKKTAPEKRAEFKKELDDQFDSWGMVNTKKLDEMIKQMLNNTTGTTTSSTTPAPSTTPTSSSTADIDPPGANEKTTVKLTNGKVFSSKGLREDAINAGKKDKAYQKLENPYIRRPLPNVDANGKIEASVEIKEPTNPNGPLKGKVVIVNPGHGGYRFDYGYFDSGTILTVKNAEGKQMPIEEWRVANDYAKDLTTKLQAQGATVVIAQGFVADKKTGKGGMAEDKYLENLLKGQKGSEEVRKLMRNTKKSDMAFISLHVESTDVPSTQKLCTVRTQRNDDEDNAFAKRIRDNIAQNIYALTPEIKENNYYVTRSMGDEIPSVLVEIGNIQNESITNSLLSRSDRDKYTDALLLGIKQTLLKE